MEDEEESKFHMQNGGKHLNQETMKIKLHPRIHEFSKNAEAVSKF